MGVSVCEKTIKYKTMINLMSVLYSPADGARLIHFLCRPLESILSRHSIGRILQFIHLFGYLSLVGLTFFYSQVRLPALIIFSSVLLLFFIFNGCILTKAEMEYLGTNETVPGRVLDAFHLRPKCRETDKKVQVAGSLVALAIPIIFILWNSKSNVGVGTIHSSII